MALQLEWIDADTAFIFLVVEGAGKKYNLLVEMFRVLREIRQVMTI